MWSRILARWRIYLRAVLRFVFAPFRWFIRWAYHRWCFKEDEYISTYIMEFLPSDLRCVNPKFLVHQINERSGAINLRARVTNLGHEIFRVSLERKDADRNGTRP